MENEGKNLKRRSTDHEEFTKEDVEAIAKDVKSLRKDIIKEQQRVRLKFIAIVAAFIAVFVLIVLGFIINFRLASLANDNKKILNNIESCVSPNGQCHKNGLKDQGNAVALIGTIMVSAIDCSNQHPNNPPAIKSCITQSVGIALP